MYIMLYIENTFFRANFSVYGSSWYIPNTILCWSLSLAERHCILMSSVMQYFLLICSKVPLVRPYSGPTKGVFKASWS